MRWVVGGVGERWVWSPCLWRGKILSAVRFRWLSRGVPLVRMSDWLTTVAI